MWPARLKVSDLISRPPVVVTPTTSIKDSAKLMYEEKVGSVVVTSPEGKVIGIFTEKDLVRVVSEGLPLTTQIGDIMTKNPIVIREDEPLSKAVIIMTERGIRHLPVVDAEGRVKGVISARDIAYKLEMFMGE